MKLAFPNGEPNATFADLPAPTLEWEKMAEAPVARLDGAAIQIKNLLYVFAGYGTIDHVRISLAAKQNMDAPHYCNDMDDLFNFLPC